MDKNDIIEYNAKSFKELTLRDIMRQAYCQHIVVPAFNVPYVDVPALKPSLKRHSSNSFL